MSVGDNHSYHYLIKELKERIAELEQELAQCKEAYAAASKGQPLTPIIESHINQNIMKENASLKEQLREMDEENTRILNLLDDKEEQLRVRDEDDFWRGMTEYLLSVCGDYLDTLPVSKESEPVVTQLRAMRKQLKDGSVKG